MLCFDVRRRVLLGRACDIDDQARRIDERELLVGPKGAGRNRKSNGMRRGLCDGERRRQGPVARFKLCSVAQRRVWEYEHDAAGALCPPLDGLGIAIQIQDESGFFRARENAEVVDDHGCERGGCRVELRWF